MIPVSTIKSDNGNVFCETPDGTVINININQRSVLDGLLDIIRTHRTMKKSATDTKPTSGTAAGARLGLGVSLISLGCINVMLAVILCVARPEIFIVNTGTHFWVGFPLIVSGALNIVACRYPKACWEGLAFISLLLSLGISIGGMVHAINDINLLSWNNMFNNICEDLRQRKDPYYYGYGMTRPPSDYYSSDWEFSRCKMGFQQYEKLLFGLVIMTLLMMIWGLCISIISLGCRLKALCCGCTCEKPVEEEDDPLLLPIPGEIFTV
ncbi:transmembrane protein 176B-like [Mixophyes fleayi]|uniref:transmembrane protein 176B-like n=1 Tax=Mixophyes fleayi TaxID=3061075 RepID=UPI003F4D7CAF